MPISEPTLSQFRQLTDGTAQATIIEFLFAQDHDARVAAIQKAVDFACNLLEQHKHKKQDQDEDTITLDLCSMLTMAGFQAAHDKDVGGHCDICVVGKDMFLWLAEAKKHSDYAWLDKGFQQLSTRYSTGVKGQDHGEIIVYCYAKNAKAMLKKWCDELKKKNPSVRIDAPSGANPLHFCSTHEHVSSGLDFHIRHKVVALHWEPKDK